MSDTITKVSAASATLASPKLARNKSAAAAFPVGTTTAAFGCEHLHEFSKQGAFSKITTRYQDIVGAIRDQHPTVTQSFQTSITSKNSDATKRNGSIRSTLRSTWLCVQCPWIVSEENRKAHWDSKQHSFIVDSRTCALYCNGCEDFVFDPHLERLRLSYGTKKRKFSEYANPEDYRMVIANSTHVSCRASGLRGLYNMGSTCFMSAVVQCLIHNPFIQAFYLSQGHPATDDHTANGKTCMSCTLDDVFTEFYATEKTEGYGAVQMLQASWMAAEASNSELAGYSQKDAHEYMQFILNALHSTNGGKMDNCDCIIHKSFHGKLQSTVTCRKCKNQTTAIDPFMDLSLNVHEQVKKKKLTGASKSDGSIDMCLEECLESYTAKEVLDYGCSQCKEKKAVKQLSVQSLPPVLSIHLKRFSNPNAKTQSSKIETPVRFPLTLNMAPYLTLYTAPNTLPKPSATTNSTNGVVADSGSKLDSASSSTIKTDSSGNRSPSTVEASQSDISVLPPTDPDQWPPMPYSLSAVIVHKGEINSGHYVNYAREGKDWFLFDDSKVVLVDESEVLGAEAYLLVYVTADVASWAGEELQRSDEAKEGDGEKKPPE